MICAVSVSKSWRVIQLNGVHASSCCSDAQVHCRYFQYILTSLVGVVIGGPITLKGLVMVYWFSAYRTGWVHEHHHFADLFMFTCVCLRWCHEMTSCQNKHQHFFHHAADRTEKHVRHVIWSHFWGPLSSHRLLSLRIFEFFHISVLLHSVRCAWEAVPALWCFYMRADWQACLLKVETEHSSAFMHTQFSSEWFCRKFQVKNICGISVFLKFKFKFKFIVICIDTMKFFCSNSLCLITQFTNPKRLTDKRIKGVGLHYYVGCKKQNHNISVHTEDTQ